MLVIGIDAALVNTGVAAIEDGCATWRSTIVVEGDTEDTGPRYALLRAALEKLARRVKVAPVMVVIEQPEHTLRVRRYKGKTYETDPANILKLYGGFAVVFAESSRLWPKAEIKGVRADTVSKALRAGIMRAKYRIECKDSHQWDALWLADRAWDLAVARQKRVDRSQ
jgi:hypothetical protein